MALWASNFWPSGFWADDFWVGFGGEEESTTGRSSSGRAMRRFVEIGDELIEYFSQEELEEILEWARKQNEPAKVRTIRILRVGPGAKRRRNPRKLRMTPRVQELIDRLKGKK